jgi:hypothetical protein
MNPGRRRQHPVPEVWWYPAAPPNKMPQLAGYGIAPKISAGRSIVTHIGFRADALGDA